MEFKTEFGVLKKIIGNDRVVVIPEGVKKIAFGAFNVQTVIDEIIFPTSLREIEKSAVYSASNQGALIKKLTFQEGLEMLQARGISVDMQEVYLPRSLKYIANQNFTSDYLRKVSFAYPYGWHIAGASGVFKPIQFSLSDPLLNADYFSGRKNPQGVYGLRHYDLRRY